MSFYLARRGRAQLGAWILLGNCWILATGATWFAGGLAGIIPIYYIVLTAAAGWLLGRRAAALLAATSCTALAVMTIVGVEGSRLPRFFPLPPHTVLLLFIVAIAQFSVPLLLILESVNRTQESQRESASQARARAAELQATMNAAPAMILVAHDAECRHITGNQTAYVLLQQPPGSNLSMAARDDARPRHYWWMRNGVEIPLQELPIQKAASTGQPVRNYELAVAFEDGTSVDLLGNVEPLFDSNGHPQGAVAVLSDISVFKRAEQTLAASEEAVRESEERFRSMFENATVGIYRTTPDGRILMANPALISLLGYSTFEELAHRNLEKEGFEPGYPRSDFRRLLESQGVVKGLEATWTRQNGSVVFVRESAKAVRADDGSVLYYDGIVEDFTQRKLAEEALRESEERFRNIADTCPVIIWYGGPDRQITFLNKQAVTFSGRGLEELLGSGWVEQVHPDDLVRLNSTLTSAMSEHRTFQTEFRLRRHDGNIAGCSTRRSRVLWGASSPGIPESLSISPISSGTNSRCANNWKGS